MKAYMRVLDDEEKLPNENPSVGIILCKKADKACVEYVLQDYLKPMGVATYQNNLAKKLKELLPPEEDLKNLIHSSEDDTEKKCKYLGLTRRLFSPIGKTWLVI